ncbi:hypothetical protein [Streptomyces sp. NPDC018031]|uniref:hypothetical protein n=1 Tax=Streptomyces sp. NPDC018031 TaxID=3365033 RepID=UPI003793D181
MGLILTRGARVFGSLVCAVVGLAAMAWIWRDLARTDAESVGIVWWNWIGVAQPAPEGAVLGSSLTELTLLILVMAQNPVVWRSSAASGYLAAVGAIVIALRLPGLWSVGADWTPGAPEELRTWALVTVWGEVLLAAALLIVVAAGRRPVDPGHGSGGPHPRPLLPADRPPSVPAPGAATAAALSLGALAALSAGWELYWMRELDDQLYQRLFTGEHTLPTLLAPPSAWVGWATAGLALTAAVAAWIRTGFARPLGMAVALLVIVNGVADVSRYDELGVLERFGELTTRDRLTVLTSFAEVLTGLLVIAVLARRGIAAVPPPAPVPAGPSPGHLPGAAPGGYGTFPGGGPPAPAAPPRPAAPPPPAAPPEAGR